MLRLYGKHGLPLQGVGFVSHVGASLEMEPCALVVTPQGVSSYAVWAGLKPAPTDAGTLQTASADPVGFVSHNVVNSA